MTNPVYCPDTVMANDRRLCREIFMGDRSFRTGVGHLMHKGLAERDGTYSAKLTPKGEYFALLGMLARADHLDRGWRQFRHDGLEMAKRLFAEFPRWKKDGEGDDARFFSEPISWDNQPYSVRNVWLRAVLRGYYLCVGTMKVYRFRRDGTIYSALCFVDPALFGYKVERSVESMVRERQEAIREREARAAKRARQLAEAERVYFERRRAKGDKK